MGTKGTSDVAVGVCLDESGSMSGCRQETIDGFNQYMKTLRKQEGSTVVTLTKFSALMGGIPNFRTVWTNKALGKSVKLTEATYTPDGGTPLFDAIGHTISLMDAYVEAHPGVNPIVVIQTDGYENASREYTREQIVKLIRKREKKDWVFVFLGADMTNAVAEQQAVLIGLASDSAMGYVGQSSVAAFAAVSTSTEGLRAARLSGAHYDSASAGNLARSTYQESTNGSAPPAPGLTWDTTQNAWLNADGTLWLTK